MKYQLENDKCLNAIQPFLFEERNEILTNVSIWLRFSPIFNTKDLYPQVNVNGKVTSYSQLVNVVFNSSTSEFSFNKNFDSDITYEIVGYSKAVAEKDESEITKKVNMLLNTKSFMSVDVPIEKEEFDYIINNYASRFENNTSLQTLGFCWYELQSKEQGQHL